MNHRCLLLSTTQTIKPAFEGINYEELSPQIHNMKLIFYGKYIEIKLRRLYLAGSASVIHVYPLNPFKPEFTMIIFIHYKLRIAVAILDL